MTVWYYGTNVPSNHAATGWLTQRRAVVCVSTTAIPPRVANGQYGQYQGAWHGRGDCRDLATKLRDLDYAEAAAVPLAGITAWRGLFDHGGLRPGQRVLIHVGGGGVGHFAIQFAKAMGAVVATTVSQDDLEFVRELGADRPIDCKNERFEYAVRDVDLVLDLVGGATQDRSWAVLKRGGAIVSTLSKPSEENARSRGARAEHYMAQPNAAESQEITALEA